GRDRYRRPHGLARPRLPAAGRRHCRAGQDAADGRRADRRARRSGGIADFHAHLQGAAQRHRPCGVLRDGQLAGARGRAARRSAARRGLRRAAAGCGEPGALSDGNETRERMKAAATQMTSVRDAAANLAQAERLLTAAAEAGAELAVLPENFSFMGATDAERVAATENFGDGAAQDFLATQARRNGLTIVGGTIPIRDGGERAAQRSLVYGPDGSLVAHYDKIHLFDVDIPGRDERYAESATTQPGTRPVVARTAAGRIGLTVCYDIRFPALFHRLSVLGVDVL